MSDFPGQEPPAQSPPEVARQQDVAPAAAPPEYPAPPPAPAAPEYAAPPVPAERPATTGKVSGPVLAAVSLAVLCLVVITVCALFVAVQSRRQTSLLRRQGCLQETSFIRAFEPSTEPNAQLAAKQLSEARKCVGLKP